MSAQIAAPRRRPPLRPAALADRLGHPARSLVGLHRLIFPSIEDALSKAIQSYPEALKEAFGISELTNVEQYLQAEMLSLIVPLALGYLAVRAIASGLTGAAESGRLDVLLSAPVSRRRLVPPASSRPRSSSRGPGHHGRAHLPRQPRGGRRPLLRLGPCRLRQCLALGAAFRRPRRDRRRLLAAHQRHHRRGRRACW